MKRFIRALTVTTLLVLSALTLSACSAKSEHIGLYECAYIRSQGDSFPVEDVFDEGAALELDTGGKAALRLNSAEYPAHWSESGGELTLTLDFASGTYRGTVENGVCVLPISDDGTEYVFVRAGAYAPEAADPAQPDAAATELQSAWNGGWYGMWSISNAEGDWRALDRQSYDLFARIAVDENGEGTMTLWDEKLSEAEPMGVLNIAVTLGDEKGARTVTVTGGKLWLSAIDPGGIELEYIPDGGAIIPDGEPAEDETAEPESDCGTLYAAQAHYSADEGSFDFALILRPWGADWNAVELAAPQLLPYYYEAWYLPAIEAGEGFTPSVDALAPAPADNAANKENEKE